MALVLYDRVQQTGTANTTVSFTLSGSVTGYQSFSVVGNGNTTYYGATDTSGNWEVGIGTYATGGTLTRTTILASSNSGSAVTFSCTVTVFVTYPSERSVNLDGSGNVSALGTVASGTWNGSTIPVAYGGTGVTASSGANSVMLRDANQNVSINRLNQSSTTTTAAGTTTTLTAASTFSQILNGTGGQTFKLPDATTLTNTTTFEFNNNATGTLTIVDNASGAVGTITSGGAAAIALLSNGTVAGTWDVHAYIPESVTWGTNSLALGSTVISGGTWQGGTIASGYGGTGLTTFTAANNALYSTSASALAAGTLPVAAGGTGVTTSTGSGANVLGTNPTIQATGSGFTLVDATDNTKQANFDLSGLTTGTSYTYALPATSGSTLAVLGRAQTWSAAQTFSGAVTQSASAYAFNSTGANWTAGSQTTGTFTVGGASQTGAITLGRSTVSQQTDIQAGATASGSTKTVNLGTGGLAGSTTNIAIGSTTGTSTTTLNGTVSLANALPITFGGTGQTTAAAAFNALNPMTTTGDIIYEASASTAARLPVGSTGQVLTVAGGIPSWATPATGAGTITVTDFTATSGQTTFTVSYTVGLVEVYQNGARLAIADYTATNGTSIVLATGATTGDLIEVVAFSSLNIYSTITSETFSGTGSQTVFTMSAVPANTASLLVAISGVVQDPTTYSVSSTTLTFTTAPPSASGNISVRYLGIASVGTVGSFSAGTTGFTPSTATTGAVVLAGTLNIANGGTGLSTIGSNGTVLTSNGTTASWAAAAGATITGTTTSGTYYVVGTTSTSGSLTTASISNTNAVSYNASTGALTAVSMVSSSDERLKSNIQTLTNAVQTVENLRGVSYLRNDRPEIGVVAQEVEKVLPMLVHEDPEGYKSVAYGNMVGLLIEAVKELSAEVKVLKAELNNGTN